MSDQTQDPGSDTPGGNDDEDRAENGEDRQAREEQFAQEHDPANHDVTAGEEFRQRGDWTAGDDGPQVQQADGGGQDGSDASEQANAEQGGREISDGGYGWGSAAPFDDGEMPEGHPVKAWTDTMTHVCEGEEGYDAAPHVWFTDAEAAERAGFRRAHG